MDGGSLQRASQLDIGDYDNSSKWQYPSNYKINKFYCFRYCCIVGALKDTDRACPLASGYEMLICLLYKRKIINIIIDDTALN